MQSVPIALKSLKRRLAAAQAKGTFPRNIPRHLREFATNPVIKRYGAPNLHQLVGASQHVFLTADSLLEHMAPGGPPAEALRQEYADLHAEMEQRRRTLPLATLYPEYFAVEVETAFFLYAVVRRTRPRHVMETGVANGCSAFFLLNALERNGQGTLHSIDLGDNVGVLVRDAERARWELTILRPIRLRAAFRDHIRALPPLDLFIHDSDHSPRWQAFEYEQASGRLRAGGILASDDVDWSYAFSDFCRRGQLHPAFLVDRRKVFGVVRPRGVAMSGGQG